MLVTILLITIALVGWALHLMQQAVDHREFSLMLAGTLVAFSAAALITVYVLMGNCISYFTNSLQQHPSYQVISSDWDAIEALSQFPPGLAAPLPY
jgi:ABC-type lipoprotein release transport system permease subunit